MFKWDQKYELGNEKIDAEHRIFLGLIVDFHDAALQGASKDKLIRIYREICKYAEFHFLSEENLMADCDYPDMEQHSKLHNGLLARANDKFHQFCADKETVDEIFQFLFEWFALHTSQEDKKLVTYLGDDSP